MARKVTQQICAAFMENRKLTVGNSYTDGKVLQLFNNTIAEWRDDGLWITTAGFHTVTTKERLNGLPGVSVHTAKHQLHLNGEEWDGEWTKVK